MQFAAVTRHFHRGPQHVASKSFDLNLGLTYLLNVHTGRAFRHYSISAPTFKVQEQEQPTQIQQGPSVRKLSTTQLAEIPHILVPSSVYATDPNHVADIAHHLGPKHGGGILKLSLSFTDPSSSYLEQLIRSLHSQHGHQLPISHSATVNWFWDVRPTSPETDDTPAAAQAKARARSETMNEFPWHTDCSYEDPAPRFIALHVLQHDRLGGGTLSVLNAAALASLLSASTREALQRREYKIATPPEFVKDPSRRFITGPLLAKDHYSTTSADETKNVGCQWVMRFRRDIVQPTSQRAAEALEELDQVVKSSRVLDHVLDFGPTELPRGSIILLDNRRWLHCRNEVRDPDRHLRRVRWDAVPFGHQE